MENGTDRAVEFARLHHLEEVGLVDVVGDLAIDEIAELVGPGEVVDGDDVALAAFVQCLDEVGADEAGRAGNDGIHVMPSAGPPRARHTPPWGAAKEYG